MTTFRETIALIPFRPVSDHASGMLPSIVRAMGHILYLVATYGNNEGYEIVDEEALRELEHAKAHLARTIAVTETSPISTAAKGQFILFVTAVSEAHAEFTEWPADERGPNLKDLADRAAALAAFLDLELAGIRDSDPGRTL